MCHRSRLTSPLDPRDPRDSRAASIALGLTAGAALGTVFGLLLESLAIGLGLGVGIGFALALVSMPSTTGRGT